MLRLESITPLGKPVVPDVYCMLITSSSADARPRARRAPRRDTRAARRAKRRRTGVNAVPAPSVADEDQRARAPGIAPAVGADRGQLVDVVDVAEAADRDERRRFALAQQVVDVARAQRGVGGDENRADLRERELQHDPLGHVRRPERRRARRAATPSAIRPRAIVRASLLERRERESRAAARRRAPRGPAARAPDASSRSPTVTSRNGAAESIAAGLCHRSPFCD